MTNFNDKNPGISFDFDKLVFLDEIMLNLNKAYKSFVKRDSETLYVYL